MSVCSPGTLSSPGIEGTAAGAVAVAVGSISIESKAEAEVEAGMETVTFGMFKFGMILLSGACICMCCARNAALISRSARRDEARWEAESVRLL